VFWRRLKSEQQRGREKSAESATPRRLKTYQAETGYVYSYVFCEHHSAMGFTEYRFLLDPERESERGIALLFSDDVRRDLEEDLGRELSHPECYAIVKVSLFRLFDEIPDPASIPSEHLLTQQAALDAMALLDL